mmetsp:Transcript_124961/g.176331  ORF Transcript_124961/g.176331 Transcript_124961/m.176331 type:complete len:98 (+) Transcript_124961:25-318(+)
MGPNLRLLTSLVEDRRKEAAGIIMEASRFLSCKEDIVVEVHQKTTILSRISCESDDRKEAARHETACPCHQSKWNNTPLLPQAPLAPRFERCFLPWR